jgi:hypothetical protein
MRKTEKTARMPLVRHGCAGCRVFNVQNGDMTNLQICKACVAVETDVTVEWNPCIVSAGQIEEHELSRLIFI